MDHDEELKAFKKLVGAGFLFLISSFFAYAEFKYFCLGETVEAQVTRQFETKEMAGRGRSRKMLAVEYTFTDRDGRQWSERDDVPLGGPPVGQKVAVQYLPGVDDSSRLAGHEKWLAVCICLGGLGWLTYSIYSMCREANEPIGHRRR